MSKWTLLALSVIAVALAIFMYRRVEDIRRSPIDGANSNRDLMHLPLPQRAERAESSKMYTPHRVLAAAVGIAVGFILATLRAFFG